jgi:phenylacetate-CoA ligase
MPGLKLKGVDLTPRCDTFDPIEVASRDEIAALQLERLKWTLHRVYDNVVHYREAFDRAGVHPSDLKALDDLRRFPFTTKSELREKYPFGLMAMPREQLARIHVSSGTTGKPTVVGYSLRDIDIWASLIARSLRAGGCRPGMLAQNSYGYGLFTGGLGFHYGAEKFGLTVVPVSGGMTERQVKLIDDFEPDVIFVTPSYLLAILDEFRAQGLNPKKSALKIAMCGAEPWTNAMREEIEAAFDLHAIDNYGLSEVIGPGVACECIEAKDGPVIWEDHFYPEVIDPVTGNVLPDGEVGELVFTSLTKEAMPVVRYRTRDLSRLLPGSARSFRRMQKVIGRSDDMMIIRSVNVFPSQIEEVILKDERVAPHFVIELSRVERLDAITVIVEARADTTHSAVEACGRDLARHIKGTVGINAVVKVAKPGTVERSAGKAKRVIDLRAKD